MVSVFTIENLNHVCRVNLLCSIDHEQSLYQDTRIFSMQMINRSGGEDYNLQLQIFSVRCPTATGCTRNAMATNLRGRVRVTDAMNEEVVAESPYFGALVPFRWTVIWFCVSSFLNSRTVNSLHLSLSLVTRHMFVSITIVILLPLIIAAVHIPRLLNTNYPWRLAAKVSLKITAVCMVA